MRRRPNFQACLPTPARFNRRRPNDVWKLFTLQRTRLELIAERKVRRRQLTDDANVEITGRDLREREQRAPAEQIAFEWATR